MKSKIVLLSLLALVLAVPVLAQTTLTQFPANCIPGGLNSQFIFAPQSGAYAASPGPGLYNCISPNVAALFGGGGASKLLLLSDVTATTTAVTVFSFPVLANVNYTFSCTLFWQNSSTNADTFTLTTPSSPTSVLAFGELIYNATGSTNTAPFTGSPLALSSTAAGAGATTYKATISGGIQNGANAGSIAFQISASSGTATIKANSYCAANSAP
jgi:hypothetical protein